MMFRLLCWLGWPLFAFGAMFGIQTVAAADVDYAKQVKPLLASRCYACHGALKQKGGLRLDTAAAALRGGDSGPAVVPRDPAKSELLARVSARDPADRMPPEYEGEPLNADQIETLRAWIAAGADHPNDEQPEPDPREHWAFRPITRPPVPKVPNQDRVNNPIDAFVAQKHREHGLTPQSEASRALLLRRLSLDLIGMPPTLEELSALQNDQADGWYERAVRRLLDDPRYGERWARHWMDIWRYSDWWGLGNELRNSQKHIWHWRDWIIESLNADLPYDEMVRQMLAADELYPNDLGKLRATGFLARNYFLFNRHQWMDEAVEHVSKAFLGLTMNCVRCHDHKYDPFPQVDYYRLRAIFEPYHARLDIVPGEADLERDGIPRVFDARLNEPTYRFIRGDEKNPDTSAEIAPGVPSMIAPELPEISPVELPVEAWQPQRRPWVIPAHLDAARHRLQAAENALAAIEAKLAEVTPDGNAKSEHPVAVAAVALARAELTALQERAKAWQSIWGNADETTKQATRATAIRADRDLAVIRARHQLVIAERDVERANADMKAAAEKAVQSADENLNKAMAAVAADIKPNDPLPEFLGARWTPTRFLNSGADDPAPAFAPHSSGRRNALAKWITDRRHPLTARVAVNHLWTRHFGAPLVPTVFDFGRNGQPPTHPELLDWLASELIESGWSMKHLHRLIVESAAYRMTSSLHEASFAKDPDNRYLWRRMPSRLESQVVRDSLLALAGSLDPTRGGPPILPAQQADSKRRSVYFFHSNNDRNLFLTMFDEALVTDCYRREQSVVPQQALAMTNSRLVLELSPLIAEQITKHLPTADRDDDFVRAGFLLLLASEPTESELRASLSALEAWRRLPEAGSDAAARTFARGNLVWVLLNHNDFITIR